MLVYQAGEWVPLQRGDVVSDDRYIKTLGNGRVQFTRGSESIEVAGHSLIQILDRDGQRSTSVHQHYGKIAVDVDKRDVNHFSVTTPYLAAIVKGTQFAVQSGSTGASVSVDRGQVNVADPETGTSVDISPGQGASVDPAGAFKVSATGDAELPIIRTSAGGVTGAQQSGRPDSAGAPPEGGRGSGSGSGSNSSGNPGGNHASDNASNASGNAGGVAGNASGNAAGNSANGNGNADGRRGN